MPIDPAHITTTHASSSGPADARGFSLHRLHYHLRSVPGYTRAFFVWPALVLLLGTLLWTFTESKLKQDKQDVARHAYQRASSLSAAYAEQLARTIQEIDRITLLVKHQWQSSDATLRLDEYDRNGIFPKSMFHVSIASRAGDVVSSTLGPPRPLNFANRDWFQSHASSQVPGLLISKPDIDPHTGQLVIRFSRALHDPKGAFAGVAWVTVEPAYLTTFYGGAQLSRGEFISARFKDGPGMATKVGGHGDRSGLYYRQKPLFATAQGVAIEPKEKFTDQEARIVAWKKLDDYGLVALAGLTEHEVYGDYRAAAADWRNLAAAGTLLLIVLGVVGTYYSIRLALRKRQAEEVKNTYRLAVDAAQEGFYMLRPMYDAQRAIVDFRVEDCNERGAALIGYTREQVLGRPFSELLSKSFQRDTGPVLRRVMEVGFYEEEFRVPSASPVKPTWIYRRFVRSGEGVALTVRDISHAKAHEQDLSRLANTDTLTGLPNRHWLASFLPAALERTQGGLKQLAVLFIDLDDFKNINDTLGHDAGDELLKTVAQRLKSAVRASDHVVRLGGDEFTVVLEQVETMQAVSRVAEVIVRTLGEPFVLGGIGNQRIRASVGVSVFPRDGDDGETLLKHADIAMYAAKAAGKGRYHFYQAHLSDSLILRLNKEQALRTAIERDEFVVHYQPRIGTESGQLCSMEALVRWNHPEHGLIFPAEFIHIAEETGLIVKLGRLVIEKVCAQLASWKAQAVPLVPVSINASAAQFAAGNMKGLLAQITSAYRVDPALIEIELTESTMLTTGAAVAKDLEGLRAMGIKLLIDDFGTGYSSLSQLRDIDVDVLKIDRAFTKGLCEDKEGEIFFKAIVSLGHALDMTIVAEGVETPEQLRALKALSCDSIQGHLVSRAVPADEMARMMLSPALLEDEVVT